MTPSTKQVRLAHLNYGPEINEVDTFIHISDVRPLLEAMEEIKNIDPESGTTLADCIWSAKAALEPFRELLEKK